MGLCIEFISSAADAFFAIQFMNGCYKRNRKCKHYNAALFLFFVMFSIAGFLSGILPQPGNELLSFGAPVIMVMFLCFAMEGKWKKKLFISCFFFLVMISVNIVVLVFMQQATGIGTEYMLSYGSRERMTVLFADKLVLGIVTYMIVMLFEKREKLILEEEWILFAALQLFFIMIMAGMIRIILTGDSVLLPKGIVFIILTGLLAVYIIMMQLMLWMHERNAEQQRYVLMLQKIEEKKQEVRQIEETAHQIMIMKHDLANVFSCILELLETNHYQEAKQYVKAYQKDKIEKISTVIQSENETVNAVINAKLAICEKEDILCHCRIEEKAEGVDAVDLSVLLANLFDNAIEAEKKLKGEKEIIFDMRAYKGYLIITIKNLVEKKVLDENGLLQTTKEDKQKHGFGMSSMKEIVEKYEGYLSFSDEMKQDGRVYFCGKAVLRSKKGE